jgi:hypothetical protein
MVGETRCKIKILALKSSKLSILWVVEADKRYIKYATEGLFSDFLQIFDMLLRLTELTNLDDSNANIFYFELSYFYHKIF